MNALRRILAVLFLLLGGAGLLLCLAALIGVWPARSALQDRLGSLYGRVDGVIDTAGQDLRVVREALGKSRETLTAYKNATTPTSPDAGKRRLLLRTLSASFGKELAPNAARPR